MSHEKNVILALGDSLTAGYGLLPGQDWPSLVEAMYRDQGRDVEIVNAGVSGDTTGGGLARLDWILDERVDYAVVALGANDGLQGVDPAVMEENLDAILQTLDERGVPTLLSGMYAMPNLGMAYGEAYNSVFRRVAARHEVLFDPFLLEGVAGEPHLNQADGIHPNARGMEAIARRLKPLLDALMAGRRGTAR